MEGALEGSGRRASDVVALAAGLAGFYQEDDRGWADAFFDVAMGCIARGRS